MSATSMRMNRRDFLKLGAAAMATLPLAACTTERTRAGTKGQVIVIGAGYGGATAAKYIRMWSGYNIAVTIVEQNQNLISCPLSNLVIAGNRTLAQQTGTYTNLHRKHGIKMVHDEAIGIDPDKRLVRMANGGALQYDRLILSPGIDFMYGAIPGVARTNGHETVLHAWKAGWQTIDLRQQLQAMPDGGVYILGIPKAPYRCLAAPYERACLIANYFKNAKPRSKVIILDANPDITAKKELFTKAWEELYPGMIEYLANHAVIEVDSRSKIAKTDFGNFKGDVLNIIPSQRAGKVAQLAGVMNVGNRWCAVDFRTYESTAGHQIHVIGDAISATLPKSGHMANNQAHVCAAAVIARINNVDIIPEPRFADTCYSFVSDTEAVHIGAVYAFDPKKKVMVPVEGSAGASEARSTIEARYANAWAINIWDDMLG